MMPGAGIQHPGEQPVLQRNFEEHLIREKFVTEDRMRRTVSTLVRQAMEEFDENRRRLVEMVEQVNTLSGQFEARVTQASSQIGSEVQARDAQLREHIDSSARQSNEARATMHQKMAENFEILKKQIGEFVAMEQTKLTVEMHRIVADNESKAQLLYQQALQAGSAAGQEEAQVQAVAPPTPGRGTSMMSGILKLPTWRRALLQLLLRSGSTTWSCTSRQSVPPGRA